MVPLVKLVSPVGQTFGLDVQLLKNIYAGHSLDASSIGPVYLAPDGRVLIEIIRQLVKGFTRDERLRTKEVLEKAGSQADTLAKAFRGYPDWERLKAHIKQQRGVCWLEP